MEVFDPASTREVELLVKSSQRQIATDGHQSVSLGVEPHLGLMTRYLLLLTVTVYLMWGALSDERTVCRLQFLLVLASAVILGSEPLGTRDRILLSQI
jgi:hypothetical protein